MDGEACGCTPGTTRNAVPRCRARIRRCLAGATVPAVEGGTPTVPTDPVSCSSTDVCGYDVLGAVDCRFVSILGDVRAVWDNYDYDIQHHDCSACSSSIPCSPRSPE